MSTSALGVDLPVTVSERPSWSERPLVGTAVRSTRYRRTRVGAALVLLCVLCAVLGPVVAPHSATEFVGAPYSAPSSAAWFGTDALGRDVFSRVLFGAGSVLIVALVATMLGMAIGVGTGVVAGYSRPWIDHALMRPTDVILAFPQIVLVLLFVSMFGPKVWLLCLLVGVSHAPRVARLARGVTVEAASHEYVEAVEALGVPRRRILTREILPNLTTPLLVEFGLRLTWTIALIAALSFVGFGLQPPSANWGLMINENRNGLLVQPWAVLAPIMAIAVLTIGTNILTEGFARAAAGIEGRAVRRGRA
jgi:peptide/nickel transport system permease protein